MNVRGSEARRSSADQRYVGIAALVAAQGLDLATTLYGLRSPGIVETNPVAAAAIARLGAAPGLVCLAALVIVGAVVVTESTTARYGDTLLSSGRLRWLGYAPHVCLSVAAALNNVVLVSLV